MEVREVEVREVEVFEVEVREVEREVRDRRRIGAICCWVCEASNESHSLRAYEKK